MAEATSREQRAPAKAKDVGEAEVAAALEDEQAKGYHGEVPDPTPNENYTAAKSDAPTPETDPELAAAAREARSAR
jgi:hypothetical protein